MQPDDSTTDRRTRNAEAQKRRRERQHDAGKTQFRAWVTVSEALKLRAALAEWRTEATAEAIRARRLQKMEELRRRAHGPADASSADDHEDGDAFQDTESSDQHARQRKLRALLARRHIK